MNRAVLALVGLFLAFASTTFAQQSPIVDDNIFIRGGTRYYPLLRKLHINKSTEQMQAESQRGRFRFRTMIETASMPHQKDLLAFVTPVKDQGHRGTCVAFASVALVETLVKSANKQTMDLSEEFIYWASKSLPGATLPNSDGSFPLNMLNTAAKYGVPAEQVWPYELRGWWSDSTNHKNCVDAYKKNPEKLPTECVTNGTAPQAASEAQKVKVVGQQEVETTPETIVGFINSGFPVAIGVSVFEKAWGFDDPKSDKFIEGLVTVPDAADKEIGGHAVLIVGYDLDAQVYLFKNSWGTSEWGSKSKYPGFGTMPMNYVRKFGIAAVAKLAK